MPSLEARAANMVFRHYVKRTFERGHTVESLRVMAKRFDRFAPPPPRDTHAAEVDLGNFTAERVWTPSSSRERFVLYLPGGAFLTRTPAMHRGIVARICRAARARALLAFYRLAPEHPFPAALDDCVHAYEHLLEEGIGPARIVIGGDSAGGALTLATLMALRDRGLPLPAGAFTISAVTDLRNHTNGSRTTNRDLDPLLSIDGTERWHLYYVAGDESALSNPLVSPVLGEFTGLPPLLLQASTTEVLLDDSQLVAEAARAAGVRCELELFDGVAHVWQMVPQLPESRRAVRSIGDFVRIHTRRRGAPT